ncbi:membrane protein, partial [Plesiomonas sp. ZOR0011]|uniref:membrane protein n=1 Tax=Plesiomonas sp. ZOR0011 TaxID=1339230 RepID=UPI000646AF4E
LRWFTAMALVLWLGWVFLVQERHGGAALIIMSVMNRPISYVYVNGNMGGNTDAFNGWNVGGKTAGPYRIEGNTVKIDWELDMTEEQEKAGYKFEKHTITLPMPKREKGQNDFCVLMLPDNTPMVRWAISCHIDMQDVFRIYRERK